VNSLRLSRGAEDSPPRELWSGDIVQFGVDVLENQRKGSDSSDASVHIGIEARYKWHLLFSSENLERIFTGKIISFYAFKGCFKKSIRSLNGSVLSVIESSAIFQPDLTQNGYFFMHAISLKMRCFF